MKALFAGLLFLLSSLAALAGEEIKGDWKFPSDIDVYAGRVYVVDGLNNRISVYDLYGNHITDIKAENPYGIDVEDGLIYVTNQKGKLYVFDEFGNLERELSLEGRPIDVKKVKDRLYITNGEDESLDIYTLDGELIERVGGKGTSPSNFVGIFLLDASKDRLFVVDSVNARVQEFNLDGEFVGSIGRFGIEEGELFRPKGVAYCGDGKVAISDGITGAVQLFNQYGGFEELVMSGLHYPTALACYEGELFVLEPLQKRVSIFRLQGVK